MQRKAAETLAWLCGHHLQFVLPSQIHFLKEWENSVRLFYGPRRIAVQLQLYPNDDIHAGTLAPERLDSAAEIRGPRIGAPDAAIDGFLRKYGADRSQLENENGHYILRREIKISTAKELVVSELLPNLSKLGWPKSMRWGQGADFAWVRPLRRVVCLLDGEIIPFELGPITASNETEGHRTLAPGAFPVSSCADWQEKLRAHHVIADQEERREKILRGITEQAAIHGLTVVKDEALIDEVTGLVEWPVPLIGKIDKHFMDLPPEVRELSMKVNQRYFALRDATGNPAPYFAFVANLEAPDNGAAIIAGNERVLRARLSDARHFWDLDLKIPLDALLPKLDHITFHAKIGSQGERAKRIATLAAEIAGTLGADKQQVEQARWAGLLCKADLVTGMVGEFPELQGVIGGYYGERNPNGWDGQTVGPAIKTHYQPKGPTDDVPRGIMAVSVALADKLDTLIQFFRINERPTGSGDPYALRRAALGVVRIILENKLKLPLHRYLDGNDGLFGFIIERLRVKLKSDGLRFDILDAVLAIRRNDDLLNIMQRVDAVNKIVSSEVGRNVLLAYRRAANILRIENEIDGPHTMESILDELSTEEERGLQFALKNISVAEVDSFNNGDYFPFLSYLSTLRRPTDAFFEKVKINTSQQHLRRSRLGQLALLIDRMNLVADFSKIEG